MALPVVFKHGTRAQYDSLNKEDIVSNALYFLDDTGEILRGTKNLAKSNHYHVDFDAEKDTDDIAAINRKIEETKIAEGLEQLQAVKEDTAVVIRSLVNDKKSYTSYVYDGSNWMAMDGNYSAENVFLTDDITVTTTVGTITELTNGSATFNVKGMSVQKAFEKLLAEEKEPTITDPSYSLTASATTTTGEVGGYINKLNWNGTWSAGSYEYGSKEDTSSDTGITAVYLVTNNINDSTSDELDGSFILDNNIQIDTVGSKTYATITGECTYSASTRTPVTNLGADAAAGALEAGEFTKTANVKVSGYRRVFYGTYDEKGNNGTDSATIRSLGDSLQDETVKTNVAYNIAIPATAQRVVFAYPSTYKDLTAILDKNDSNANILPAFAKTTVKVEGANGFEAIDYKVYTFDAAGALGQSNTFIVTIPA